MGRNLDSMKVRRSYRVVACPEPDGRSIRFEVPELADTSTVALDVLEGEVLVRQAIAIATNSDDTASFDVEMVDAAPGL